MTGEMFINLLLIASLTANALSLLFILFFVAKFKIIKKTIDQCLKDNKKLKRERDTAVGNYEMYYRMYYDEMNRQKTAYKHTTSKQANDARIPNAIKSQSYSPTSFSEPTKSSIDVNQQALTNSLLTSPLGGYDYGSDFVSSCTHDSVHGSGSSNCLSFGD